MEMQREEVEKRRRKRRRRTGRGAHHDLFLSPIFCLKLIGLDEAQMEEHSLENLYSEPSISF